MDEKFSLALGGILVSCHRLQIKKPACNAGSLIGDDAGCRGDSLHSESHCFCLSVFFTVSVRDGLNPFSPLH